MDYVFTLVHGTFAGDATWIEAGSRFAERLRSAFGDNNVTVLPFRWSGRNTATERRRASLSLAQQLKRSISEHPCAQQIVVGHSHGGTVALLALRDRTVATRVGGVICLSTPFIHVQKRKDELHFSALVALPALTFILTFALLLQVGTITKPTDWLLPTTIAGLAALYSGVFLDGRWGGSSVRAHAEKVQRDLAIARVDPTLDEAPSHLGDMIRLSVRLREEADQATSRDGVLLDSLSLPNLDRRSTYLIRVAGDEASGVLAIARMASWVSTQVTNFQARFFKWALAAVAGATGLITLVVVIRSWYSKALPYAFADTLLSPFVAVGAFFTAGALLVLGLGILAFPFVAVQLLLCVFGHDLLPLFSRFEFTCEDTPQGNWTTEQLSFADARLRHSAAYDHPDVASLIFKWVQKL